MASSPDVRSLWESFHHNINLGGSCGEIHAMLNGGRKLINPLVAAQNLYVSRSRWTLKLRRANAANTRWIDPTWSLSWLRSSCRYRTSWTRPSKPLSATSRSCPAPSRLTAIEPSRADRWSSASVYLPLKSAHRCRYFHGDHSMAERLGSKGIYGMSIFKKNMYVLQCTL
jgi:chitin synthase